MRQKIIATAAATALLAVGVASADVCYFKIESLDWDQLEERTSDAEEIADPNFSSITAAEMALVTEKFEELGEEALTTPPGVYAGSSMSRGIWYRKAPCEVSSVEDLAGFYNAPFKSGLDYRFEQVSKSLFDRANSGDSEQCAQCYTVHRSRQ